MKKNLLDFVIRKLFLNSTTRTCIIFEINMPNKKTSFYIHETVKKVRTTQPEIYKIKTKWFYHMWWYTYLIPALGEQRQADLCEF